ncbi:hypothetical protein HHK36_011511 [Tetracentron sinense]|uniref:Uncharacterized protein n=1 Tax=Tetracentron sinense TaxID=13715 RepID=A0A835DH97_TETSI|nr:hypothetical protein HHK36_011511 [Tetracentron sinense]
MTEIKCCRFVVEKKCFQIQRFENAHGNSTRIAEKGSQGHTHYLWIPEEAISGFTSTISILIKATYLEGSVVGTPKTHRRFLTCDNGTYGPMSRRITKGLLEMPLSTTMDSNCVGDSCFPGQGVIAVAFSGVMCALRVAAILACLVMSLPKLGKSPFRNTFLTSSWNIFKFIFAAKAITTLTKFSLATRQTVSS